MIFQGIWTSIAKKPYIFVIFSGGGGGGGGPDPLSPPLDPPMASTMKMIFNLVLFSLDGENYEDADAAGEAEELIEEGK